MKKKILCALIGVSLLCGCSSAAKSTSSSSKSGQTDVTPTEAAETTPAETTVAPAPADLPKDDELDDYITVAEYKNIEMEASADTVLEKDMYANIDFTGKMNGEAFEGGAGKDYDLLIGSGTFIPGFEDQLIGHKAGDKFTIQVTFPETYGSAELAGKDAEFDIVLNKILKKTVSQAMTEDVVGKSTMKKYPQSLYDYWKQYYVDHYAYYAKQYEMEVKDYLNMIHSTEEIYDTNAQDAVKAYLVLRKMMTAEGITEESDEYKEALEKALGSYGFKSIDEAASSGMGITREQAELAVLHQVGYGIIEKYQKKA